MLQKAGNGLLSGIHTIDAGLMYGPNWRQIEDQQRTEAQQQAQQRAMQQQLVQLQLAQAQKASVAPDQISASMRTAGMPRLQATSPDASGLSELTPQKPSDFQQMLGASQSLLRQGNTDGAKDVRSFAMAQQGMGGAMPASLQEWQAFQQMSPTDQKAYLNMKRQPAAAQIADIAGVKSLVDRVNASVTPLSSLDREAGAQATLNQAKAEGTAMGETKGSIAKKAVNANTVIGMLDIADPLIDAATGSMAGAARDKLAAVFGEAPKGAQAIAQLKVLQAGLMTNMPRMEGPQSDRDVDLYREAAGQIGDPMVPAQIKKAAVMTIRALQNKYREQGGAAPESKSIKRTGRDKSGRKVVEYSDGSVAYGD